MLTYPEIDPVALAVGPITVHWYGIAYALAFLCAGGIAAYRSRQPWSPVGVKQVEDSVFYCAIGVILGGRLGYIFFYEFSRFLAEPLWLFKIWEGGMSFHGGFLGVCGAMVVFAKRNGLYFRQLSDFVAPLCPLGLLFGRLGNFIGQELWGRETSGWWGMVFPNDPLGLVRHPSQLYHACLEGFLLFVILWLLSRRQRPMGFISGVFLIGYGCFRFIVEFAREPDAHLAANLLFGWMTRGQLLCVPMLIVGGVFIWSAYRHHPLKAAK